MTSVRVRLVSQMHERGLQKESILKRSCLDDVSRESCLYVGSIDRFLISIVINESYIYVLENIFCQVLIAFSSQSIFIWLKGRLK